MHAEYLQRVKDSGTKLILGIGSGGVAWIDSDEAFSRLVNNAALRQRFAITVAKWVSEKDFDGVDISWLMPHCWWHGKM